MPACRHAQRIATRSSARMQQREEAQGAGRMDGGVRKEGRDMHQGGGGRDHNKARERRETRETRARRERKGGEVVEDVREEENSRRRWHGRSASGAICLVPHPSHWPSSHESGRQVRKDVENGVG
eukprot:766836-Hanusia_phi.AAC.1